MDKKKKIDSRGKESNRTNDSNINISLYDINISIEPLTLKKLTRSEINGEALIELNKLKRKGVISIE